jgi:hypothetical protein
VQSNALSLGLVAGLAAISFLFVVLAARPTLTVAAAASPMPCPGRHPRCSPRDKPSQHVRWSSLPGATVGLADGGPFRRLPPWAATLGCLVVSALLIAAATFHAQGLTSGRANSRG